MMGPGKVTTTGGAYTIALESPHELTHGSFQQLTYGCGQVTSHGGAQRELSICP